MPCRRYSFVRGTHRSRRATFEKDAHETMRILHLFLWAATLLMATEQVDALDKVIFATNWKAQAAQGGFYQSLADGTYRRYRLDVTIQQGGPSVNNRPLLPAGRIDFLLTGNLL